MLVRMHLSKKQLANYSSTANFWSQFGAKIKKSASQISGMLILVTPTGFKPVTF